MSSVVADATPAVLATVQNSIAILSRRWRIGALAQLGERLLCKHQVIGSIPIGSTTHSCEAKRARLTSIDEANEILVVDTGWDGVSTPLPIFDIVNGFFKSMP